MIPCSCAASNASAICFAIGSASPTGIGPAAMRSASVGPFDQFHDEGGLPVGLLEPVEGRDVGMVERGQGLGLAVEACQAIAVACERVGQNLDRHLPPEVHVGRAVDFAHSARADGAVISNEPILVPGLSATQMGL
jgi:hypothetical protein